MLIQIVLLAAIVAVTYLLGHSTSSSRHMAFRRMFLIAFATIATAAVIFPQLMTTVAGWFGVGRGADLLLYLMVVAFIGSLAMQSRRATELNRRITLLNRRLAILEAETLPQQQPHRPAPEFINEERPATGVRAMAQTAVH